MTLFGQDNAGPKDERLYDFSGGPFWTSRHFA